MDTLKFKMDCSSIQRRLLEGQLDSQAERHVADCRECQKYQYALERFLAAKSAEKALPPPPKHVDSLIRKVAKEQLAIPNIDKPQFKRSAFGWITTAAAAVLLAGWIAVKFIDSGASPALTPQAPPVNIADHQRDKDVQDNICDLQIAIELDMATICFSCNDDDGEVEEVLNELDQNDLSLPPIWS